MSLTTPWSGLVEEGAYRVAFPQIVRRGDVVYSFVRWEDGSPDPVRTVEVEFPLTLFGEYVALALPYIPPLAAPAEERRRRVVLVCESTGRVAVQLADIALVVGGGAGYVDSVPVKVVHNKRGGYDLKAADPCVRLTRGSDGPKYHFIVASGESVVVRLVPDKKGGYGFQAV